MKGDFSRNTHRPASQYSRVMMQQGRVQIDADWNEQTSILLDTMRALTRDLFGHHAGPQDECGFKIATSANQAGLSAAEKAQIELETKTKALAANDLIVLPGRYYVGGLPAFSPRLLRYSAQSGVTLETKLPDTLADKSWLAYLDVWEDYVAPDQDEHMREIALGGADTCGRARVNWRIRLMLDPPVRDPLAKLDREKPALLKVVANPAEPADALCSIDPDARYRGAENQLYRIEIQTGSQGGNAPSFKWSRDNGSVTFPVTSSTGVSLTLANLGNDERTGLTVGDWVELVDDERTAVFGVGQMAQVSAIDKYYNTVSLKAPPATALRSYDEVEAKSLHALLRRWDQNGKAADQNGGAIIAKPNQPIELEDGIFATFKEGDFHAGDYWYIPARVLTGDVEWDHVPESDGFRPPDGPAHFYAPLASSKPGDFKDLRCQIARLKCI
jgi:hypothetical protein